jgi:hypothetical protein
MPRPSSNLREVLQNVDKFFGAAVQRQVEKKASQVEGYLRIQLSKMFKVLAKQGTGLKTQPRFGSYSPSWERLSPVTLRRKRKYVPKNRHPAFFLKTGKFRQYLETTDPFTIFGGMKIEVQKNLVRTGQAYQQATGRSNQLRVQGVRPGGRTGVVPKSEFETVSLVRVRIRAFGRTKLERKFDHEIDELFPDDIQHLLLNRPHIHYRPLVGPFLRFYLREVIPDLLRKRYGNDVDIR